MTSAERAEHHRFTYCGHPFGAYYEATAPIQGGRVNALRIVLPLGVAAFVASLVIGNTHVSLGEDDCGTAFGGASYSRNINFYVACAPMLSNNDTSATALLWLSIGLLVSSAALYWGHRSPTRVPLVPPLGRDVVPPMPPAPDYRERGPGEPVAPAPSLRHGPSKSPRTRKAPPGKAKVVDSEAESELPLNLGDQVIVDDIEDSYNGMLGFISEVTETLDDYLFAVTFDIGSRQESHAFWANQLRRVAR